MTSLKSVGARSVGLRGQVSDLASGDPAAPPDAPHAPSTVRLWTDPRLDGPPNILQGGIAASLIPTAVVLGTELVDRARLTSFDARLIAPTPLDTELVAMVHHPLGDGTDWTVEVQHFGRTTVSGIANFDGPAGDEPELPQLRAFAFGDLPQPQPQPHMASCVVCGSAAVDGLDLHPGIMDGDRVLNAWTPGPEHVDDNTGRIDLRWLAGALDCPTAWATKRHLDENGWIGALLGGFRYRRFRDVADEPVRIAASLDAADGRKFRATSAMFTESGDLIATASTFMIGVASIPAPPV